MDINSLQLPMVNGNPYTAYQPMLQQAPFNQIQVGKFSTSTAYVHLEGRNTW